MEFCEVVARAQAEIADLRSPLFQACQIFDAMGLQIVSWADLEPRSPAIMEDALRLVALYRGLKTRLRAAMEDLHLATVLNPARELAWIQADVSGVDLSGARIDMEALANVIWTSDTTWPLRIADDVRARSDELQPGVYKVRGHGSGRTDLAKV